MNCQEIKTKMLELIDGELSERQEELCREHLQQCEKCEKEYRSLIAADERISQSLAYLAPERMELNEERYRRIEDGMERDRKFIRLSRVTAMAAGLLVVFTAAFLFSSGWWGGQSATAEDYGADRQEGSSAGRVVEESGGQEASEPELKVEIAGDPGSSNDTVEGYVKKKGENSIGQISDDVELLRVSKPDTRVPVKSNLYDPDQDSMWW
ncbi:MAG: anti-sigma factor family protein [Planctomycetota bacterium]